MVVGADSLRHLSSPFLSSAIVMEERLRSLSPQARAAVNVFAGAASPMKELGVHNAMSTLRTRAANARKRVDDRYFQGR